MKEKYSNRSSLGGGKPREYLVESLADYIKLLVKKGYDNHAFRGENFNYFETNSSALRKFSNNFMNTQPEYPFIEMKNQFKKEIWYKLNEKESENFLAFAQHHGIPTNLIDFTNSPLVALFFACQPYDLKKDEDCLRNNKGFVYVIDYNDTIDFTTIINECNDKNLFEEFLSNDMIFIKVYSCFLEFSNNNYDLFIRYFLELITDIEHFNTFSRTIKKKRKRKITDKDIMELLLIYDSISYKELIEKIEDNQLKYDYIVFLFVYALRDLMITCKDNKETGVLLGLPLLIYRPLLSFERVRNQQGLFIYQFFLSLGIEETYGTYCMLKQKIPANEIIIINNKEKILNELDMIGINSKFIYSDFDNIAKYIKDKYS